MTNKKLFMNLDLEEDNKKGIFLYLVLPNEDLRKISFYRIEEEVEYATLIKDLEYLESLDFESLGEIHTRFGVAIGYKFFGSDFQGGLTRVGLQALTPEEIQLGQEYVVDMESKKETLVEKAKGHLKGFLN